MIVENVFDERVGIGMSLNSRRNTLQNEQCVYVCVCYVHSMRGRKNARLERVRDWTDGRTAIKPLSEYRSPSVAAADSVPLATPRPAANEI